MKPHPRIRKTIKWGGLALTVLLVGVWVGSKWYRASWASPYDFQASIWHGRLELTIGTVTQTPISRHFFSFGRDPGGLSWGMHWRKWPTWYLVVVPMWVFPCTALLITAVLWRADRRAWLHEHPHLCPKCNYNHTGLASGGPCPECGTVPKSV